MEQTTTHFPRRAFVALPIPLMLGALLCPVLIGVPTALCYADDTPGSAAAGNAATPTPPPAPSPLATRPSTGSALDKSAQYITRTVHLYFYQDAERMLQDMAGPRVPLRVGDPERIRTAIGDLDKAQKAARDAATQLLTKQADKVAKTTAWQKAKDAADKAQTVLDDATSLLNKAKGLVTERTQTKTVATRQVTLKQRELNVLKARRTVLEGIKVLTPGQKAELADLRDRKIPKAEAELLDLQDQESSAAAGLTEATTGQTDAQTKVTEAQTALGSKTSAQKSALSNLETAQTELTNAHKVADAAVVTANSTAAELEDARRALEGRTGPLVLLNEPTANDPLERVQITAERGGVLLLHGTPDDVKLVADVVRQRDRPGAQVRAVFWTLQASGAGTKNGRRALQNSSQEMVFHTKLAQDQVATCGATLRDAILLVYEKYSSDLKAPADPKYPFSFFHPRIVDALKFGKGLDARERQFQPLNLSTFGEAAAVVALAQRNYREEILDRFFAMLPQRLATMEIRHSVEAKRIPPLSLDPALPPEQAMTAAIQRSPLWNDLVSHYSQTTQFSELRGFLHYEIRSTNPGQPRLQAGRDDLTPIQQEVLRFWSGTKPRLWLSLDSQILLLDQGIAGALNLSGEELQTYADANFSVESVSTNPPAKNVTMKPLLKEKILARRAFNHLLGLSENTGLEAMTAVPGANGGRTLMSDVSTDEKKWAQQLRDEMYKQAATLDLKGLFTGDPNDPMRATAPNNAERLINRLTFRGRSDAGGALDHRASVASIDASIRRLMQATEQDLENQFVLPALNRVRESAAGRGITLGIVERNSVIAMNRSVARVDPRASYEIQLPAQGNLQKDAVQLATFAMGLGSGNVLTGLTALGGLKPSNVEDLPGTYFVQSGNTIEFTPVVGPDGQSIRMNVRLQRDSPVQMPNREKGQNFARIERHNINTDVQDTNFEMLEIARFDNQTTLAENRQRRGGIPILNQLPIIREIPLIGWFTKNREPVVGQQQSLVFMQTAIYPSIEDLMGLFDEEGAQ